MQRAARGGVLANCKSHDWERSRLMSVYAFGPFVLDPAETSADARRPARGRSEKGLADPAAAGRGRRSAGAARDLPGEALAQRRGRGPHAHRPHVDPAQGARRRPAEDYIETVTRAGYAWPCQCVSCRRPRPARPPAAAADGRNQTARGAAFLDGQSRRGRQLSRGRHRRCGDDGAGRLPGLAVSPAGGGGPRPGADARRWSTCSKARCSAATSSCASRHG